MRESQPASPRRAVLPPALHADDRRAGPRRRAAALGGGAIAMFLILCLTATTLAAQIRGRPAARAPDAGWWFSGGAAAVILKDISDGATRSTWTFGSDPRWQMRGTLERRSTRPPPSVYRQATGWSTSGSRR